MEETRQLWIQEINHNRSLTTLQAALLLNSIFNMFDMDSLSTAYMVEAAKIAQELELFEPTTYILNKKLRNSYDLTAWSFFHWQWYVPYPMRLTKADDISTLSYQLMTVPILSTPPRNSLPHPKHDPVWLGEIWLKYPSTSVLIPLQLGMIFKAKTEFAVALNEIMLDIHQLSTDESLTRNGPEAILEVIRKLEKCYEALPEALSPSNIVFPSQLKIQYVIPQILEAERSY